MRSLLARFTIVGALVVGMTAAGLGVADVASAASTDTLSAGQQLTVGQSLISADGRYTAIMQGDGNFVVYGPAGAGWNTGGSSANRIVMQGDGNLVSYNASGGYTWSSSTAPSSGDRLVMQSDGNLVIYSGSNIALWSNGQLLTSNAAIRSFQSWALNQANWNSRTPSGTPGIDSDGYYGAQCADLGIAWSKQAGHSVGFDGWDSSSSSKPGWHYVSGNFGAAQPGDVVTRVGGKQHVVVVVGSPSGGVVSVLQQNPGSPAVASYPTSTFGVIWRLN
jgi:hypothetical protein